MRFYLGLLVALVIFGGLVYGVRDYLIDDTYIHLQYAKQLRAGNGLVFNTGEAVPGTTSPLWSLFLGIVPTLQYDLVLVSKWVSGALGLLALLAFAVSATRFYTSHGIAALATIAWAANAWMARWTPSGMETSLAVLLALFGWWVGFANGRVPTPGRRFWVSFLWGLASLVRPEFAILLALYLFFSVLIPGSREVKPTVGERFGSFFSMAFGVLLSLVPFVIFAYFTYGSVLPGTLAAKSAGGVDVAVAISRLVHSAKIVGAVCAVEGLVFLLFLPRLRSTLSHGDRALHLAAIGWLILVPLGYAIRGVPVISRYLVPLLPFLVLYGWALLDDWWRDAHSGLKRVAIATAIVLALAFNGVIYYTQVVPHTQKFVDGMDRTLVAWGQWLGENAEPDDVVATPDIGAIGYYSDLKVLDLGGLVSPDIVPVMQKMPYDELVSSFAFRVAGEPRFLVDRGYGTHRLLFESPFADALKPLFTETSQSLGVTQPRPIDYTLYEIDWVVADSLFNRAEIAGGVDDPNVASATPGDERVPASTPRKESSPPRHDPAPEAESE